MIISTGLLEPVRRTLTDPEVRRVSQQFTVNVDGIAGTLVAGQGFDKSIPMQDGILRERVFPKNFQGEISVGEGESIDGVFDFALLVDFDGSVIVINQSHEGFV